MYHKTNIVPSLFSHILSFAAHALSLGRWWGASPPQFPTELVVGYTKYIMQQGGVVTWDVPVRRRFMRLRGASPSKIRAISELFWRARLCRAAFFNRF
jgi:hypothetical protein